MTYGPKKIEDFEIFLPRYLSADDQRDLLDSLKNYPNNLNGKSFYTERLSEAEFVFQGDTFKEIKMADYESEKFHSVKGFLVSNTCDTFLGNDRLYTPYFTFAPIFSLKKYKESLESAKLTGINEHIKAIESQKVSSFFFLPKFGDMEDSFVRFDYMFSMKCELDLLKSMLQKRISTLSDYGFYLLLFKLSIHFARIQEKVERNKGTIQS